MDRLEEEDRAREAGSLLGHRVFVEAVAGLRRSIIERLLVLPAGDPKVSELHTKAKVLDELVGELRSYVAATKVRRHGQERVTDDGFR